MRIFPTVVVLCALVAVGCAHSPQAPMNRTFSEERPQAETVGQAVDGLQPPAGEERKIAAPDTSASGSPAAEVEAEADKDDFDAMIEAPSAETATIADPLEPFNRAMFQFNDRLYFWVLKPLAQGYKAVVPEPARVSVRNFFYNLRYPVRAVNCLLQIDPACFVIESSRFVINTTLGFAGLFDPSSYDEHLKKNDRELGQTLGIYGVGQGFYIVWPVIGPSSPRETVGAVGDAFLNPVSYLSPWPVELGVRSYQEINATSLTIGDYEVFKEAAIDPYVSMRNAWIQYRQKKVEMQGAGEDLKVPPGVPKD